MSFKNIRLLLLALSTIWILLLTSISVFAGGRSYDSEYIVFAGRDSKGKVVFAMETLRSEGTKWEWTLADHSVYLFDEGEGWVKLKGRNGSLDARGKSKKIGGESSFEIRGGSGMGMTVTSAANGLILRMKDEKVALDNRKGSEYCKLSSGKATMHWGGRNLKGQVYRRGIHLEGVSEMNRVTNAAKRGAHSEALYLNVGELGFFYGYRHNDKFIAKHAGRSGCMLSTDSLNVHVNKPQFSATKWKSIGFYDMPYEWQGAFRSEAKEIRFKVTSTHLKNTENYFLKGARIGYARGFVSINGRSYPLYGISEVSNCVDGRKEIVEMEGKNARPPEMTGQTFEAVLTRLD